jgi:tetrapyrrole methylase family protein/MazG family protein
MSLRTYLLEEAHEVLEAIEARPEDLTEELGDVLLQVLLHAQIASEDAAGFDIGDIATATATKLVARHPHVFGGERLHTADQVTASWERLKAREKPERLSMVDGLPRTLPALSLASAVLRRMAGVDLDLGATAEQAIEHIGAALPALAGTSSGAAGLEEGVGELLLAVVALARSLGVDPEHALRREVGRTTARFRQIEARMREEGLDPHLAGADEWRRRWSDHLRFPAPPE